MKASPVDATRFGEGVPVAVACPMQLKNEVKDGRGLGRDLSQDNPRTKPSSPGCGQLSVQDVGAHLFWAVSPSHVVSISLLNRRQARELGLDAELEHLDFRDCHCGVSLAFPMRWSDAPLPEDELWSGLEVRGQLEARMVGGGQQRQPTDQPTNCSRLFARSEVLPRTCKQPPPGCIKQLWGGWASCQRASIQSGQHGRLEQLQGNSG